jgi:KH domain
VSREVIVLPRKIDWMLQDRSDDLKTIMSDNGAFIAFPPLGSQASQVTVYGDQRSPIQRTIRSLMGLAVHVYIATFWLLPLGYNALMPPPSLNQKQITMTLEAIVRTCDVEAVYKKNLFEFHGLEADVRAAIATLREMDVVKSFGHEIHFQIELATEHRDFISGKKNGKINKIMQTTSVNIKFETFNDYNFLISVQGTDKSALQGLSYLQEELPAEISFHVPENYHKRIIGVGGKSIQKIMKRFGTFVKFSNAEEYATLGGYHNNDDNVLARTPTKNAINLENLRLAIMELVHPKVSWFDLIADTLR